jgi:hypothetical protein
MDGIVLFDWSFFLLRYAELSYIGEPLLQLYWNEAAVFCDNTPSSPIQDASVGGLRYMVLHMATAHVAALNAASSAGAPASTLVGRIASAGQGSVNVSTTLEGESAGRAYWAQTKYGLAFWQATARYRQFRYASKHGRRMDVFSPLIGSR